MKIKTVIAVAIPVALLTVLIWTKHLGDLWGNSTAGTSFAENRPQTQSRPNAFEAAQAELKTLNNLRAKSTNNAPFQKWGREVMIGQVNAHIAKVPVFGLSGGLVESNTIVNTFLTPEGAEFWLHTKDLKYRFRYTHGVMLEAIASEADITGIGRDPDKIQRFADDAGPWSKDDAREAAETLLRKSGLDPSDIGIKGAPAVTPDTFKIPGTQKEVTPFYTVTWFGKQKELILEIRFRRTSAGTWEPTYWFNNWRPAKDPEAMSYSNLVARFF